MTRSPAIRRALTCVLASVWLGCGSPSGPDGGEDAGTQPELDGGPDASADASVDAGFDAGVDAGFDAGEPCPVNAPGPFNPQLEVVLLDGGALPTPLFTNQRLEVRVRDLPPCSDVALSVTLDAGFATTARFVSSPRGVVSTAQQAPVAGRWSAVDPDAIFWSLSGGVGGFIEHDATFLVEWDGGSALTTSIARSVLPPGTTVTSFRETTTTGLYGDFMRPPGAGPFPGVVVFGGSEGGLNGGILTGQALVREGFAVLAVAYFGVPGKPPDMLRLPLEVFHRAAQRLRAMPDVRVGKIGVVGVSRGGEAALLAAANFPTDFDAVVSLVGGGYAWAAPGSSADSTWTVGGNDVPFLPWPTGMNGTYVNDAGLTVSLSAPYFLDGLLAATPAQRSAAEIPVERINGPVLLYASGDDGIWPSCTLTQTAWNRLADAGHTQAKGDRYRCFAGAGHTINPTRAGFPLADLNERGTTPPLIGYGGSAPVDSAANFVIASEIPAFLRLALQ